MAEWLNVMVPAIIAMISAAVIFGMVRESGKRTLEGQHEIRDSLSVLVQAVAELNTSTSVQSAVNAALHTETDRRIKDIEESVEHHGRDIQVLRTKVHMLSGKMTEMSPEWKPYKDE